MSDKNLYCVIAHHGLALHNSGRAYLCCQSRKYFEDQQGQQIYFDTHTLQDAWNSPTRLEIQQALDAGIEHPSCQACWESEHAGKQSRRQYHNSLGHNIKPNLDQPQIFDLKMGNVCNMKCRTCNPEVSSQWYREDWELNAKLQEGIDFKDYLVRWKRIPASYNDENTNLWETMRQWIPNADYIDYYGAEPMLIQKNFEVLQYAVDQGTAKDINLHFSTNATVWSEEIENLLNNFRKVYFDVSIDDIEDRFGYIRYPSNWTQIKSNIDKFVLAKENNPKFNFGICITINNLNIYYLDEIFEFFANQSLICNFNLLHLPWHLNLKILPIEIKKKILEKLKSKKFNFDPNHQSWWNNYWNTHLTVLENFMMGETDSERYFREFHYYTRGLDHSRQQKFEESLPEFSALVKPWFDQFDRETGY